MSDILVRPTELKQAAQQLDARAKRISSALQEIDKLMLSLKGDRFLGMRADAVQRHYAPKREALLKAKDVVSHFAAELEQTANRFEQADKQSTPTSSDSVQSSQKDSKSEGKLPPVNEFVLNQWDKRWANIKMNNQTGETLRNYGCLMTVISMISRIYGVDTNPAKVDAWIEAHGGYPQNGSYMSTDIQVRFLNDTLGRKGSMSTVYTGDHTNTGASLISQNLDQGRPVILHIDSSANPKDGHFVLAVGTDAKGNYICADPNGGKQVTVQSSSIRSARVYN